MSRDVLIVLVTCPPKTAGRLARRLVGERVAACVNVVRRVESYYRWKGRVQRDPEALLVIKTSRRRFTALKQAVLRHHPYELPEVVAVSVERGHQPYLDWVLDNIH